jgi:hypothetical protein
MYFLSSNFESMLKFLGLENDEKRKGRGRRGRKNKKGKIEMREAKRKRKTRMMRKRERRRRSLHGKYLEVICRPRLFEKNRTRMT